MASNVIDRPAKAGEDRLDMKAYAEALTKFIKDAQAPLTIALQGEWGSGKTSLMNALKANLVDSTDAPYLGVWINTWQYALMSDPAEAIQNILQGIIGQVSDTAKQSLGERISIIRKIARLGGGIASDVFKKYSAIDVKQCVKDWQDGSETVSSKSGVEDLKDELAGLVKKSLDESKSKRGYLFFIDDLDRIDPPVAVQILELLKNIFDLENCIFVLAIDYGVVVKGLKPKFGAMTAENEREFRSFFDKIIQLPFSMPVGRYRIDDFLTGSLVGIGYLDEAESKNEDLKRVLTSYALESVGTNPRSLKRLINYLSLIRLLIEKTETKEDDEDFKAWKDILFAMVCLQIQYPKVYDALIDEPDFPAWGEAFEQKMRLPKLEAEEVAKLSKMEEFDEPWEQMLFRFCRRDTFLEARSILVSRTLNRIKSRILDAKQPVGDTVQWLMRLSAVTSVKNEPGKAQEAMNFNSSEYLKGFRAHTLHLSDIWSDDGSHGWETVLADGVYLSSWQRRVQSNLCCELWTGMKTYSDSTGDFLTEPYFNISHNGKTFILKVWGEFWGNWPKEKYLGIDFSADAIKPDLAKTLEGVGSAWSSFGVKGNCGCNSGSYVGGGDIWWNVTIPFESHEELVGDEFSEKLRGSLVKLAEAFSALLGYRVKVNNK